MVFAKTRRALRSLFAVLLVSLFATTALAQSGQLLAKRGAILDAKLSTTLNSKLNHAGYPFSLTVTDSLFHRHPELRGVVIYGHIEHVTPASATHKATMSMIFDDLLFPDGRSAPLSVAVARMSQLEPKTHAVRDIGIIIAGAVTGHMLSKDTGHDGGTFAGAAAGFALVTSLKSDIDIKQGTIIQLRLLSDLSEPSPIP